MIKMYLVVLVRGDDVDYYLLSKSDWKEWSPDISFCEFLRDKDHNLKHMVDLNKVFKYCKKNNIELIGGTEDFGV